MGAWTLAALALLNCSCSSALLPHKMTRPNDDKNVGTGNADAAAKVCIP